VYDALSAVCSINGGHAAAAEVDAGDDDDVRC